MGPSFDGVERHLNLDGLSGHQSPKAESQKQPVGAWRIGSLDGQWGRETWLVSSTPQYHKSPSFLEFGELGNRRWHLEREEDPLVP